MISKSLSLLKSLFHFKNISPQKCFLPPSFIEPVNLLKKQIDFCDLSLCFPERHKIQPNSYLQVIN